LITLSSPVAVAVVLMPAVVAEPVVIVILQINL
jgi:hypothetical protein